MTGAAMESAAGFDCCAWLGAPPNTSRAASAVAPMPPTTRAIVRIIDPTLRKWPCRAHKRPRPRARRSIVRTSKYTTRATRYSDCFTRNRRTRRRPGGGPAIAASDGGPDAHPATPLYGPRAGERGPRRGGQVVQRRRRGGLGLLAAIAVGRPVGTGAIAAHAPSSPELSAASGGIPANGAPTRWR